MKRPLFAVVFFASLFVACFVPQKTFALTAKIVINEIGAYEASGHEWIEIFNTGNESVDLTEWKFFEADTNHGLTLVQGSFILSPGEYAVITQNSDKFVIDYPNVTVAIIDSSWGTLSESGESIALKDETETIVEEFAYIPAPKFSLERKDPHSIDYTAQNWVEHLDGNSVGSANYWSTLEEPPLSAPVHKVSVLINEFLPNSATGTEWIELLNSGDSLIDLTGFTLEDGAGTLTILETTVVPDGFFVFKLPSNKLNNAGDIIVLKDSSGTIIDQVTYGNWDDGNINNNLPTPAKGNTLARILDQDVFVETNTPTQGSMNVVPDIAEAPAKEESNSGSNIPIKTVPAQLSFPVSSIVINELVADPTDGENEFVELFNNTNAPILLTDWWIEDGSEAKTILSGAIGATAFFVVESPKGNLNNSGDLVTLHDPSGTTIDRVAYGSWDDGNIGNNAPTPKDPTSLARKNDGQDSDNDVFDFVITHNVTKRTENIITKDEMEEIKLRRNTDTRIKITELYPNPIGADTNNEFIELFNNSNSTIDLSGWQIGDNTKKRYTITQGRLNRDEYIIFKRTQTGIALNNSGEEIVTLYNEGGQLVDTVSYGGTAPEGHSYTRRANGDFVWSSKRTPGSENIIHGKSAAPVIVIYTEPDVGVGEEIVFDASDTIDPEGNFITFFWDFGDTTTSTGVYVMHTFEHAGEYTTTLIATDSSGNTSTEHVIITVQDESSFVGGPVVFESATAIEITEFIPNPSGSDEQEFIELFNPTDIQIDLSGLTLDDEEGGSRSYVIPSGTIISPGAYRVFERTETRLALNNTGDTVRLLYPDETIISLVTYGKAIEGASFAKDDRGDWDWSMTPTPGEKNTLLPIVNIQNVTKNVYEKTQSQTSLATLRSFDKGDLIITDGIVAVEPGILGSQIFYIIDPQLPIGVQIYQHQKAFPLLRVGDRVTVAGEISEVRGEMRVKIASKSDITILDHPGLGQPFQLDIVDISEQFEGSLIHINGEITEKKSSYLWIDDGTEEVKVYFKKGTGVRTSQWQLGDTLSVVGLLGETTTGHQLLPRSNDDVKKTSTTTPKTIMQANTGNISQNNAETYLTTTAGGLSAILLALFARARGLTALLWTKRVVRIAMSLIKRG